MASLNTIDLETNKLLSQKMSGLREREGGVSKLMRSKRLPLDKRK